MIDRKDKKVYNVYRGGAKMHRMRFGDRLDRSGYVADRFDNLPQWVRTIILVVVILLFATMLVFSTGCAASVRVGGPFGLISDLVNDGVKVTNNTVYNGVVERNGRVVDTLGTGQSCVVKFGLAPNLVITFKAVGQENGKPVYIGYAEQQFWSSSGGSGRMRSWVVSSIQRPRR